MPGDDTNEIGLMKDLPRTHIAELGVKVTTATHSPIPPDNPHHGSWGMRCYVERSEWIKPEVIKTPQW